MYKNKIIIIMLPTNEKTHLLLTGRNDLYYSLNLSVFSLKEDIDKFQHLYILSNEEIKTGDWIYRYEDKKVFQSKSYFSEDNPLKKGLITKIIATTDTSLGLPQPSQQFIKYYIEEYNKGNVINKVEVEVKRRIEFNGCHSYESSVNFDLKINSNNTINIKPIKDSWTREEVLQLISNFSKEFSLYNKLEFEKSLNCTIKWIDNNL